MLSNWGSHQSARRGARFRLGANTRRKLRHPETFRSHCNLPLGKIADPLAGGVDRSFSSSSLTRVCCNCDFDCIWGDGSRVPAAREIDVGGPDALQESHFMINEEVNAFGEAGICAATGLSAIDRSGLSRQGLHEVAPPKLTRRCQTAWRSAASRGASESES